MKHRKLRAALLLLTEEPPLTLGRCELARELLPDVPDTRERGHILKQALHTAISHLATMRGGWSYLICVWEYEEGRGRAESCQRLAIAQATYTREKLRALERIDVELPYLLGEIVERRTAGLSPYRTADPTAG